MFPVRARLMILTGHLEGGESLVPDAGGEPRSSPPVYRKAADDRKAETVTGSKTRLFVLTDQISIRTKMAPDR